MNQFIGYVLVNSGRAVLFQDHFWDAPVWLPRSQIVVLQAAEGTLERVIAVKQWLCSKRGLQEFTYYSEEELAE